MACGGSAPPNTLLDQWTADPTATAETIAALPPPEQLAAVEQVLLSDPQNAGQLCAVLQDGDARNRCRQVQTRPHLWRTTAAPTARLPSPLADLSPLTEPCGRHSNPQLCWSRHSLGRAQAGDEQGAAAGCLAIEAGRWQEECMFQSAEALLESRGASRYPDAISLCALSGSWVSDCLEHSVALLAQQAPPTPGGDWQPVQTGAEMITARWQDAAPQQGRQQRHALWAIASALVYVEAPAVSGAPLSILPEESWPHVRAAMAWRLLALSPGASLSALSDGLTQASATHQDTVPPAVPRRALVGLPDMWGNASAPAGAEVVPWMNVSQRVVSPDPVIDGLIVLLEAAARQPGRRGLLEAGRDHPEPLVAWSAQRLLEYAP